MDITPPISLVAILPELIVVFAAAAVLLAGQSHRASVRNSMPWLGLVGLVAALVCLRLFAVSGEVAVGSGLRFDSFADFVRISTLILGVIILLVCWSQPARGEGGEFYSMILLSLAGLMLTGASDNLVVLFMAIETVSIPGYILVTLSSNTLRNTEAGTKYFYLGAMSAAITAFGLSYLYGVAGTADLGPDAIAAISGTLSDPAGNPLAYNLAMVGIGITVIGLLFKIAAVPLHFYIADVYHGAASPVAGLLGFVPKFAGVIAILKVLALADFQIGNSAGLFWMLWLVGAASVTYGNIMAFRQDNMKRMLAYSGIAHAGYMVIGMMAAGSGPGVVGDGAAAVMFYMVVYGIANLCAFALLGLLEVRGQSVENIRDLAGLLRRHPDLALFMALAMLTLMGMPPTPGFWGKVALFGSALNSVSTLPPEHQTAMIVLVVIAAVNTAIGAAYYLRVTAACLLYENDEPAEPAPREAQRLGALMAGFLMLIFAIVPSVLFARVDRTTEMLRQADATAIVEPAPPAVADARE